MSPDHKRNNQNTYVPKQLVMEVTYLAGSDAYDMVWSGSSPEDGVIGNKLTVEIGEA